MVIAMIFVEFNWHICRKLSFMLYMPSNVLLYNQNYLVTQLSKAHSRIFSSGLCLRFLGCNTQKRKAFPIVKSYYELFCLSIIHYSNSTYIKKTVKVSGVSLIFYIWFWHTQEASERGSTLGIYFITRPRKKI